MRKKSDLPTKTCPTCLRPFAWRRKWKLNWEQVVHCSERCRRTAKSTKRDRIDAAPLENFHRGLNRAPDA